MLLNLYMNHNMRHRNKNDQLQSERSSLFVKSVNIHQWSPFTFALKDHPLSYLKPVQFEPWRPSTFKPYPWILEKKTKMRDRHRARFAGKIQSVELHHLYMFLWFGFFFPESALGDGPKKWHIFLFSTASVHTYWHMPIQIGIIR